MPSPDWSIAVTCQQNRQILTCLNLIPTQLENKSNVKIRKTLRQTELKIQIIPTYLVKTLSRYQVRYFRLLCYVIILLRYAMCTLSVL